jgi:transposase
VIGKCYKRHRATEFLSFLKEIDSRVPEDLDVHIVMDNYAIHKTPKIKAWLARRPRYHVHFTPTSASWINQVKRWFAELTRKKIQRGVHRSVRQLETDIKAFIEAHNEDPKPYRWVKLADEILAAVKRFCQKADATLCGLVSWSRNPFDQISGHFRGQMGQRDRTNFEFTTLVV